MKTTLEFKVDVNGKYCGSNCKYALVSYCGLFSAPRKWNDIETVYERLSACCDAETDALYEDMD